MPVRIFLILIYVLFGISTSSYSQGFTVSGQVIDTKSGKPIEYASILMSENGLWAITNDKGEYTISHVPRGKTSLTVRCLGYATATLPLNVTSDRRHLTIKLREDNLSLDEVQVVARRKGDDATTSYTIDRQALDNQQVLNLSDIMALLPGGKTVNSTLMNDNRISLRSDGGEKGNASFGTAIEVDGVRLNNNSMMGESMASSTRNISSSNIESVEIVTGIPSVEYGDLSNGVVKVNTRKGISAFIIEGKINQHTQQVAVNKGFELGRHHGMLNVSLEHARSFSNTVSPYTSYQRNVLSLHYTNTFMSKSTPLTLNGGLTTNIGGYNSKADPDNVLESYAKSRDNMFSGDLSIEWLLNKSWITNLSLKASVTYQDKRTENYYNAHSASTQPYIHATTEGYHIATDYDENPNADIILGPTGYWYVLEFSDQKPITYNLALKYDWNKRWGNVVNRLKIGGEYKVNGNDGRGTYYDNMRYAPTWREYRYDELPWVRNMALYAEDKITVGTGKASSLQLTAGLRNDITKISRSEYGTVSSISPRFNAKYVFWHNRKALVSHLSVHAGWGKSVKLPSFQILYPSSSYSDVLAFTPGSTADNKAFYAYYTYPSKALYNSELKWQYTNQTDIGVEMTLAGTKISISGFYHRTMNPYTAITHYTPYNYKMTTQAAIENSGIASANRRYSIDEQTGVVTLTDASGVVAPIELAYSSRQAYNTNRQYINGSPVERYGLEWIIDFPQIKPLRTTLRLDGNYYYYKGLDETLFAGAQTSSGNSTYSSYPLVGYYRGSSSTSLAVASSGTVSNGSINKQVNLNATLSTHIPKIRLIVTLRLESSLYYYDKPLSELSTGTRGIVIANAEDYFGTPYTGTERDTYIAIYPEYYSTWDNPNKLIPFAERFEWARDNDRTLYNQLAQLVKKSNYAYTMNPNRLSQYFSANLSVTKEIGDHVSVSFYANNFFNNMGHVKSSRTGLKTTLFNSGYIPKFYYGLSLKLKI